MCIGCVSVGQADSRSDAKVAWLPFGTDTRPADVQLYDNRCIESGAYVSGYEEMEDNEGMEEDSTINVKMLVGHGTFIVDTTDGTVTDTSHRPKVQRPVVKVSEDVLNRQIQDYGLVSPERVKNVVW